MKEFCLIGFLVILASGFAQEDDESLTPLMQAVLDLDVEAVRLLLASGADVNARDSQAQTALMKVPYGSYYQPEFGEIFEMLLEADGDVTVRDSEGRTPLMVAALYCQSWLVKLYLEVGSEINAKDSRGYTPLMFAMDRKRFCFAEEHNEDARYLIDHGADIFVRSAKGLTPLMQAVELSWLEMVRANSKESRY